MGLFYVANRLLLNKAITYAVALVFSNFIVTTVALSSNQFLPLTFSPV